MRRMLIWSAVACLGAVLLTDGVRAQRVRPEAAPTRPAQVEVTNFPAVQAVSGTVNVGNLPLDGAGNLRVAGAPAYRWTQVADQFPVTSPYTFGPIDVAGWRRAHFLILGASSVAANVQWGGNGFFVDDGVAFNTGRPNVVITTEVAGPQVQLVVYPTGGPTNVTVWLYLSN